MELKKGYKYTDSGMIPIDWNTKEIKEVATYRRGSFPQPYGLPQWYDDQNGMPFVQVFDVDVNMKLKPDTKQKISEIAKNRSVFAEKGSIVLTIQGSIGRIAISQYDAYIDRTLLIFKSFLIPIDKVFFLYAIFQLFQAQKINAPGSTIKTITKEALSSFIIPLPPTLSEQERIASVINDIEILIANLEKLITKKRNLKQGAMQALLSGKKRLPGFNGKWVEKKLSETSILKARIGWQGLTTAEYLDQGDYILVTGTDFQDGAINWDSCHYVDENRYSQDKNIQLKPNDILVTKDGTIGKVAYVSQVPKPATLNSGVFVIRPKDNNYLPYFFYYLLNSIYFERFLNQLSAGSTIVHLYQKDFIHFVFPLPPTLEEQEAIVQILSEMDSEIEQLDQKLSKFKMIKQGMMQNLLTGKIRLI